MKKFWKGLAGVVFILILLLSVFSFRGIAQGFLEDYGVIGQSIEKREQTGSDQQDSEKEDETRDNNLEDEGLDSNKDDESIGPIVGGENTGNEGVDFSEDTNGKVEPVFGNNKRVYLTFDDGPTPLTLDVLEVLEEYNAKASFFMIGQLMERFPNIALEVYNDGHMILPHSYTHKYSIYTSFATFYKDYFEMEDAYRNVLGFDPPPIFRFPGGSSNHSSFQYGGRQFMPRLTEDVKSRGYYYVDWNVDSGDTGHNAGNARKLLANVINGSKGKNTVVVLFHDTARNTAMLEILPEVIEFYKENGYEFKTFEDISEEELNELINLRIINRPIVRD